MLTIIHVGTQLRNCTIQLGLTQCVFTVQLNRHTPHNSIILLNVKHVLIFHKSKSDVYYVYIFVFSLFNMMPLSLF